MPRFLSLMLSVISFCTIASVLAACGQKEQKKEAEKTSIVKVAVAEKKPFRPFIESTGTLYPFEEVVVSAEIDGILREVNADNGFAVTKGMLLAAIDDTDYRLEEKKSSAELNQANANLANLKQEFQRKQSLYKEELITRQQYDDISTKLALAEAEIEKAGAMLSMSRQRISKTRVLSPMTGSVKEKKVERGNFVKNGAQLFILIRSNPLKLIFSIPEKAIANVKTGQDVIFRIEAMPGREFKGTVTVIYPNLDEKTRTLQIEAQVQNDSGSLKPGIFARVILYTGTPKEIIVVPAIAPQYEREIIRIYTVENGRIKEKQVKLGAKYGDFIEVSGGLNAGETVVVAGQQNISEGAKADVAR